MTVAPEDPGTPTAAPDELSRRRFLWSVLAAGVLSTATAGLLARDLLGRRAFSNFYDLQARALLDGHLDVAPGSLGFEAFVVDGKHHLYFPPGPALLRMPILAITDRFDGRLTTISILVAYVVTVVLLALLMWRVRRVVRPDAPLGRAEAAGYGVLLLAGTVGSTVLFLGSVPYVYHEAYAWAIPMALGSGYSLLGVINRPTTAGVIATCAFTTGAVLTRTTAGWACAGAVLLTAVFLPRAGHRDGGPRLWWQLYLAGLIPLGLGMAVNWAKFRHPYLFPIDAQVYTSLSQHRRDAIAANGGDLFSLGMIWSTTVNYFRPDGIRFTALFPFITRPPAIAHSYGGGFIDQSDRTGSVVAFMPLLFGLAVWGVITTYRRGAAAGVALLRLPLLGALAIPAGIMFFAYITHRYTAEFVPLLLLGGTIGFVDLARRADAWGRPARVGALTVMAGLGVFSMAAATATALSSQALTTQGEVLVDHITRQERVSRWFGDPIADHVHVADELPVEGLVDELVVIGDCQALYVGTGDEFLPWAEVATRELALRFTVGAATPSTGAEPLPLATFSGHEQTVLSIERSPVSGVRLTLEDTTGARSHTPWFEIADGDHFDVAVATDDRLNHIITAFDGAELEVAKESFDEDWRLAPNVFTPERPAPGAARELGLDIVESRVEPLAVCERLRAVSRD